MLKIVEQIMLPGGVGALLRVTCSSLRFVLSEECVMPVRGAENNVYMGYYG